MKKTLEYKIFNTVAIIVVTVFGIICLFPLLITLSGSFTPDKDLFGGISLIPKNPTLSSYRRILANPERVLRSYGVTIVSTAIGTALSLIITSMTGYVLYRKDFKARKYISFYFYFTTLFSGGAVPAYILYCSLGLRNNFWVLIVDGLLSVVQMFMVRSFMTSNIPNSLVEAAKIDGANDFQIYTKVVMPSIGSILATIGLMTALGYWNQWYGASLYITDQDLYPLQYLLQKIYMDAKMREEILAASQQVQDQLSMGESYKMAMVVLVTGPVVLFYPFIQKYFVSGVTIGAVKE